MTATIAWAIDKAGFTRHVREVPNGKACNCTCMDCGENLIAYHPNPLKKAAYFGHDSGSACRGESVLHKAAKKILEELADKRSSITLPSYHSTVIGKDLLGSKVYSSYKVLIPKFEMQQASSEKPMGSIILDSLVTNPVGENIGIEIYVRNKKTDADKIKFDQLPIEVMEIDLSQISWSVERDELEKLLLNGANRRWLTHLSHENAKTKAKRELPAIIKLRNDLIYNKFNDLKSQVILESRQVDIPIKTLKSKPLHLDDNPSLYLQKHISIRNLKQLDNDLFNSCDYFVADVLADGIQKKNCSIQVVFVIDGKMPKSKSTNIVFRLICDEFTKAFSFKVLLRADSKWRTALDDFAERKLKQAVT